VKLLGLDSSKMGLKACLTKDRCPHQEERCHPNSLFVGKAETSEGCY